MTRQWRKGPPPEIGWWPASAFGIHENLRWWDGKTWSECVGSEDSAERAGEQAKKKITYNDAVLWTDRWWL